jgi:two-component system, cell cycle sensor histidine kinase and response regulator CckA
VWALWSSYFLGRWLLCMDLKSAEAISIILVVEDSDIVRRCFRLILTQTHHQVLEATSCEAALILAASAPHIDVLIVDLTLPDGFGTTILWELRARFPDIGIIVTSGTPIYLWPEAAQLETAAWPDGSWQWLAKPFKSSVLVETVRTVLEKTAEIMAGSNVGPTVITNL